MTATLGVFVLRNLPLAAVGFVLVPMREAGIMLLCFFLLSFALLFRVTRGSERTNQHDQNESFLRNNILGSNFTPCIGSLASTRHDAGLSHQ